VFAIDDGIPGDTLSSPSCGDDKAAVELGKDFVGEEVEYKPTTRSYVSRSALALRRRVVPPPCIRNRYLTTLSEEEQRPFRIQRSRFDDGTARYVARMIWILFCLAVLISP